jgi:hypothetical protein
MYDTCPDDTIIKNVPSTIKLDRRQYNPPATITVVRKIIVFFQTGKVTEY